jgi:hypothetical protein
MLEPNRMAASDAGRDGPWARIAVLRAAARLAEQSSQSRGRDSSTRTTSSSPFTFGPSLLASMQSESDLAPAGSLANSIVSTGPIALHSGPPMGEAGGRDTHGGVASPLVRDLRSLLPDLSSSGSTTASTRTSSTADTAGFAGTCHASSNDRLEGEVFKGPAASAADLAQCGSAGAGLVLGPGPGPSPGGSASTNGAALPATRRTAGKSPNDAGQTSSGVPALDETSGQTMTQAATAYRHTKSSPISAVGTLQTVIVA